MNKFQAEIGGPLRQGDPGVRLIERDGAEFRFFEQPPPPFETRQGEWLVVPLLSHLRLGGTEPLRAGHRWNCHLNRTSRSTPKMPRVSATEVELFGQRLPVKIANDLPKGLAGVPAGVPPFAGLDLPGWSRISKVP